MESTCIRNLRQGLYAGNVPAGVRSRPRSGGGVAQRPRGCCTRRCTCPRAPPILPSMPVTGHSDVTADEVRKDSRPARSAPCLVRVLQAERPLDPPLLVPLAGRNSVWLSRGREARVEVENADVRLLLPDPFLSGKHATLQRVYGRWLLEDAGSRNGTFVDGVRVERLELTDGVVFEAGHGFFLFRDSTPEGAGVAPASSLHAAFDAQLQALARAAQSRAPVVLRGETGTGKEVLARAVHRWSGRSGAFQAINCAALPATLIESELFGYRKGAFSGAIEDRPGLVRSADGGTLFLDEIGDLAPPAQAAILRVLQESEVMPLGATRPVPVDFRLVVATHRDLEAMVRAGQFRADLLARISGFLLTVPPLRERREDLGLLIADLLRAHAGDRAGGVRLGVDAARALLRYGWPLNVRELEKALVVALAVGRDDALELHDFPPAVREAGVPVAPAPRSLDPEDARRRDELIELLRAHGGNVSAVARSLGKARMQVQRWICRYGVRPTLFR